MKRILLSILLVGALAACGGGGSTPAAHPTATPTIAPTIAPTATPTTAPEDTTTAPPLPTPTTPSNANLALKSTQQTLISQGLLAYVASDNAVEVGEDDDNAASVARRTVKQLAKVWHAGAAQAQGRVRPLAAPTPGACSDGEEQGTITGTNEEQFTYLFFYDAQCTQLEENLYQNITASSETAGSAFETADVFAAGGGSVETGYVTDTLSLTGIGSFPSDVSFQDTIATALANQPFADSAAACTVNATSAPCTTAYVAHLTAQSADFGFAQTFTAVPTNGLEISGGTDSTYSAALDALTLQVTPPAVTGAAASGSTTLNATLTDTTPGSFVIVDATNDATFTLTLYDGTLQGILKQTSTGYVVSTFNLSASVSGSYLGNGAITYNDGSAGLVQDFYVVK